MKRHRLILLAVLVAVIVAALVWLPRELLSLDGLRAVRDDIAAWNAAHPWLAPLAYLALYIAVTALSIPAATALSLAGGAVFGLGTGAALVIVGATLGASLACLAARYLARDWVEARFGTRLAAVQRGLDRDGLFYLFALRLVPIVPFFVVNLVFGLTRMPVVRFALVSFVGMLPATFVYVNAGTQLAQIESLADIASPGLLGALAALGLLPLVARWIVRWMQARRAWRGFERPPRYDYNLVVIGGGAAGLVAANVAATLGARVALVERGAMGGDCLNTGCVPSKALLHVAHTVAAARSAARFGVTATDRVPLDAVMAQVRGAIRSIEPHDSAERYRGLGVDVIAGIASLRTPWSVVVDGRDLTTRAIVIATGAEPVIPPIPGLAAVAPLSSETVWSLAALPARLCVVGGGAMGCELAQAFARIGSRVVLIEAADQLLPGVDAEVAALLAGRLGADGVELHLGTRALRFAGDATGGRVDCERADASTVAIEFDRVLIALGRRAVTNSLGLDAIGIPARADGAIEVDAQLRTRVPNVWACGDAIGPPYLTSLAGQQGWVAAVNALGLGPRRRSIDTRRVPAVVYTDPEIATVGRSAAECQRDGIAFERTRFDFSELDRAVTDGCTEGWVEYRSVPGRAELLGATIVGAAAGDLIALVAPWIGRRSGLNRLAALLAAYPTRAEAVARAALVWRRRNAPQWALAATRRWFSLRRS
ncbi:MAG: FAD-dependent oxidoreductase [Chromatiales bacterium]|nr:FAD-dependent oxidoreductase [Chromatiales bacterium]